jgi:hypothetical protein
MLTRRLREIDAAWQAHLRKLANPNGGAILDPDQLLQQEAAVRQQKYWERRFRL